MIGEVSFSRLSAAAERERERDLFVQLMEIFVGLAHRLRAPLALFAMSSEPHERLLSLPW